MRKHSQRTRYICHAALIAALYVVLTYVAKAFSLDSEVIQVRLSEMLCLLPIFTPAAIPGVTIGCLLANVMTGAVALDIIAGPIATLLGALGTYYLRKNKWLAAFPPVLSNALIVPFILSYGYGVPDAIPFMMLTVGIGEIISIYVLGMLLINTKIIKSLK